MGLQKKPKFSLALLFATFRHARGTIDSPGRPRQTLEQIADRCHTDKRRSAHKYTDFYTSLFEDRRDVVTNVTEAGVWRGASIAMWAEYFPNAHVTGLDPDLANVQTSLLPRWSCARRAWKRCERPPTSASSASLSAAGRVRLLEVDASNLSATEALSLVDASMDVVIDDADGHPRALQELIFHQLWRLVKPGGYYVIEDVDAQRGGLDFRDRHSSIHTTLRRAMEEHHTFWVDAHVGQSEAAWQSHKEASGPAWARDHVVHNSYLLVIRRRRAGDLPTGSKPPTSAPRARLVPRQVPAPPQFPIARAP